MRVVNGTVRSARIGGAGCTLPRYVAARRPGSRQVVLEHDADVVALARETFGYNRRSGFRLKYFVSEAASVSLVVRNRGKITGACAGVFSNAASASSMPRSSCWSTPFM